MCMVELSGTDDSIQQIVFHGKEAIELVESSLILHGSKSLVPKRPPRLSKILWSSVSNASSCAFLFL